MKKNVIVLASKLDEIDSIRHCVCQTPLIDYVTAILEQCDVANVYVVGERDTDYETIEHAVEACLQATGDCVFVRGSAIFLTPTHINQLFESLKKHSVCALGNRKQESSLLATYNAFGVQETYLKKLLVQHMTIDEPLQLVESQGAEVVTVINNFEKLLWAQGIMKQIIQSMHLSNGVCINDAESVVIGPFVRIDKGVCIEPCVTITGHTIIGEGVLIKSGSVIKNAILNPFCMIDHSHILDSQIGEHTTVGPFAHIKQNSCIGDYSRIGNFVEFKNTTFGHHSNCVHLTYLGDSEVGNHVNIGCGVVTVNYDGKVKHKTVVKDGAFVGSNVNLVAPIVIGEDTVVAAGSTITEDVLATDMAIARARQVVKAGYGVKYKKK